MKFTSIIATAGIAGLLLAGAAVAQTAAPAKPAAPMAPAAPTAPAATAAPAAPMAAGKMDKQAMSKQCSTQADAKGLHGKERKKFRDQCKKGAM